jgi:hypothetical protein
MAAREVIQLLGALVGVGVAVEALIQFEAWLAVALTSLLTIAGLRDWWRIRKHGSAKAAMHFLGWIVAFTFVVMVVAISRSHAESARDSVDGHSESWPRD